MESLKVEHMTVPVKPASSDAASEVKDETVFSVPELSWVQIDGRWSKQISSASTSDGESSDEQSQRECESRGASLEKLHQQQGKCLVVLQAQRQRTQDLEERLQAEVLRSERAESLLNAQGLALAAMAAELKERQGLKTELEAMKVHIQSLQAERDALHHELESYHVGQLSVLTKQLKEATRNCECTEEPNVFAGTSFLTTPNAYRRNYGAHGLTSLH